MPGESNRIKEGISSAKEGFSDALHWRPAAFRKDGDSTASGGTDEEKKQLVTPSTPPLRLDTPPLDQTMRPRAVRIWDVKMPPAKKTMVGGKHLVPTFGGTVGAMVMQKKRRISVEIYVADRDSLQGTESPAASNPAMDQLLRGDSMKGQDAEELRVGENVVIRLLKPLSGQHKHDASSEEGDDQTMSTIGLHGADEEQEFGAWTQGHIYDLDDVEILMMQDRGWCEIKFGVKSDTQVREVHFNSENEVESFTQVVQKLKTLQAKRNERRAHEFCATSPDSANDGKIRLLVEIVSGVRLPITDGSASDPYVIVRLGSEEVHRTKPIYNTTNPIWTVASGALFLLTATPEVFFAPASGLSFVVKDWDQLGKNDLIGRVIVAQDELLNGKGERTEFKLRDTADKKRPGMLVLRFRQATKHDILFMERLASAQNAKISGVYGDETLLPPKASTDGVLSGKHVKGLVRRGHRGSGEKLQMRVKPGPDPDRPEQETKWMTPAQLEAESEKLSTKWIEAGSGQIGKLFVEVLGCDNLPNMEAVGALGQKTDAFACLIYGDAVVNTEVIDDVLSPRWMPWTQRAFVFHMMHPSAQLYVGVFDYDAPTPMADHDPIGRATIDITNFRLDTVYTLYYDLYTSAIVKKRKIKGQIKLRLRIEIPVDKRRDLLVASVKPPEQVYVNVATYRDERVTTFVLEGKYDVHQFDTGRIAECIEELQEYEKLLPVLRKAALTVVLWRGHYPVTLWVPRCPRSPAGEERRMWGRFTKQVTVHLPMHSFTAFAGGVFLSYDFNLLPSFILFSVAWLLLTTSWYATRIPSPWYKRRTFWEIFEMVFAGRRLRHGESIDPHENEEAIKQYFAEQEEANEREKKRKEQQEREAKLHERLVDEMDAEHGGEIEMKTERKGIMPVKVPTNINPLQPILFPLQEQLELACKCVRIVRSYLTWEESYTDFWVVVVCFVGGLLLLFIPWAWLLRWLFRIFVWVFLGPWFGKPLDIFYIKKNNSTESEQKEAEKRLRKKYKDVMETAKFRQIRREERMKLKEMKRYMFGNHLAIVPRFKQARWIDRPLPASHAHPFVSDTNASYEIVSRKYGQHLTGDMVPTREIDLLSEETPLGQTGRKPGYGSTDMS